jgi:uncharacterized protein YhbP (UPF0306 family)
MELIAALLRGQSTLALATTDEQGRPCVAPLFYLVDDELSIFWLSSETSQHSVNLARVPRASATVYRHAESWKEICGVQMHGAVTVITDQMRRKAQINLYCERFQLETVFRLVISRCALFAFTPDFFRYIDNSKWFGKKIELERDTLGEWTVLRT